MEIYPGFKSKDEFWRTDTPASVRMCVVAGGAACVSVAVITLISTGVLGLLDALFIGGLGYGIWVRRSRACAVIAGLYYALNQLLIRLLPISFAVNAASMIFTYLLLGCMVLSIYGTFAFKSLYDQYLVKGSQELPPPGPLK